MALCLSIKKDIDALVEVRLSLERIKWIRRVAEYRRLRFGLGVKTEDRVGWEALTAVETALLRNSDVIEDVEERPCEAVRDE